MDEHPLETAALYLFDELERRMEAAFERALKSAFGDAPATRPVFNQGQRMSGDLKLGATTTGWTKIDRASFKSGRVTRTIYKGSPVKVKGLGRNGGIGSGYVVTGLEEREYDINVHVRKGRDQERTVKLDRIIYVIPRKAVSPELRDAK